MQAVHIPERIRHHRRSLAGLPAPERRAPWHERWLRSPWTYALIAAACLYGGALHNMYYELFAQPRAQGGGGREITRSMVAWFNGSFVVAGVLLVAVVGAGLLAIHSWRGRRRTVAVGVTLAVLALLAGLEYPALIAGIHVGGVPFFTGLHGFGPYGLFQLLIGWTTVGGLAGFGLYLLLRGDYGRRWPRYVGAAVIVAVAVGAFWWCQFQGTAPLAVPSADEVWSTVKTYAGYAGWTLLFWVVLFTLVDRWYPQRLRMWLLAVGWGASMATYVSLFLNTWVGAMMANNTTGPGLSAATATYSAPFVEESAKATVLFLLAAALRYRLLSRQSLFALAGLSAAGFAFTENIIYYIRAFLAATANPQIADPQGYALETIKLRGIYTAFGHESFTALTAIGLTAAVMSRSKSVRILAPITGFLGAAFGHMMFNGSSGLIGGDENQVKLVYLAIGIAIVAVMLGVSALNWYREGRRLRARLTDFIRMGWLRPTDARDYMTLLGRWKVLWRAIFQWRPRPSHVVGTVSMIRAMTELAWLRDAMCRGVVHDAGLEREKELLDKIRALRGTAEDLAPRRRRGQAVAPIFAPVQPAVAGYAGQDRPWGPTGW